MTAVPALLAPIRERADKATEGPWEVDRNTPFTSDLVGIFAPARKHYILQVENQDDVDDPTSDEDIKFIAAARTDIPRLLAALDGVLALANAWEARGEHDMAYSKTIQDEDIAMELLTNGAGMVENARHIRNAVVAALQEGDK